MLKSSRFQSPCICMLITGLFALLISACGTAAAPSPTPTPDPQIVLGKKIFTQECARCHALNEDTVIVGPSLQGIASRAGERTPSQDAHAYLMTSILRPNDYVVEGFQTGLMPTTLGKQLTGEEIDAVVAYLLTLE